MRTTEQAILDIAAILMMNGETSPTIALSKAASLDKRFVAVLDERFIPMWEELSRRFPKDAA